MGIEFSAFTVAANLSRSMGPPSIENERQETGVWTPEIPQADPVVLDCPSHEHPGSDDQRGSA